MENKAATAVPLIVKTALNFALFKRTAKCVAITTPNVNIKDLSKKFHSFFLAVQKHKAVIQIEGVPDKKKMIFNADILQDQKYKDMINQNPETYSTEEIDVELKYENMNMN
jgi:hypothetical protein